MIDATIDRQIPAPEDLPRDIPALDKLIAREAAAARTFDARTVAKLAKAYQSVEKGFVEARGAAKTARIRSILDNTRVSLRLNHMARLHVLIAGHYSRQNDMDDTTRGERYQFHLQYSAVFKVAEQQAMDRSFKSPARPKKAPSAKPTRHAKG